MSAIPMLSLSVLMITFATISCRAAEESVDDSFKPAQGWILVKSGPVSEVKAAVIEYDSLVRDERPGIFRIELHPQSTGAVAVVLPKGLPAYDLTNMTGWLNAPPGQETVHDAASWITSPESGTKYYLEPETSNPWSDTLIGASASGQSIRVSLPETGMSEVSASYSYRHEPDIEISTQPVIIEVTLDTSTAFGNPMFILNSPKDHDWRW